jgi:hypothetical protein
MTVLPASSLETSVKACPRSSSFLTGPARAPSSNLLMIFSARNDQAAGVLARNSDAGPTSGLTIPNDAISRATVKPVQRIKSNAGRHHRK